MIAGQRSGQWPRPWESRKGDKAGATRRGPCPQHALWASKSAHKGRSLFCEFGDEVCGQAYIFLLER